MVSLNTLVVPYLIIVYPVGDLQREQCLFPFLVGESYDVSIEGLCI